jgi:putative transposase
LLSLTRATQARSTGLPEEVTLARTANGHGVADGSVALGGRRVPVTRPRVRTTDGHEVPLDTYAHFASDDLLTTVVMERMLAGVATRWHARVAETIGEQATSTAKATSRSAVSRGFIKSTETARWPS